MTCSESLPSPDLKSFSALKYSLVLSATCPKCDHDRAYFYQLQIRSADEPMTTCDSCASCTHQWREG
ncbi:transcription factor S-II-domain-containing protein [Amylostereum chailletii]|nr:transcription factor S-II-domain-containing protein [Amylostereum chailletii]